MNMNTSIRNERDIYVQYLNDISKYPLLSREQEVLLLKKIRQGNRAAMDLLVKEKTGETEALELKIEGE